MPAPEIHDRAAVHLHADAGTDLILFGEIDLEGLTYRGEAVVAVAVDGSVGSCGIGHRPCAPVAPLEEDRRNAKIALEASRSGVVL
jgi:hypothetical protein